MTTSFIQQIRVPLLAAAFAFVLGAEVQCPGAGEAQRVSLASMQADIDENSGAWQRGLGPVWMWLPAPEPAVTASR